MEGCSGTPLAKKLGIKRGFHIYLVNQPAHYKSLFEDFPEDTIELTDPEITTVDFIHVFCRTQDEMKNYLPSLKSLLKMDGLLWISWPKGTSKIVTDLNRDLIRSYVLEEIKLVDVKVAAIDKNWSGLKFVYRKADRK